MVDPRRPPATDPPLSAANQRRWVWAFVTAIPGVYALFYALTWSSVGPRDFDQFLTFHALQHWNQALFGLAKQWTPLMCAGLPMSGEPQIPVLSLSMVLTYAMGPLLGIKLATIVYLCAGWIGAYLYAGLWQRDRRIGALAASLFIGNGFFMYRIAVGHIDFVPFLSLPLLLWGLHRSAVSRPELPWLVRVARTLGLALAYAVALTLIIDGSPVAIIHLGFWVGLYALVLAYQAWTLRPLLVLGLAGVMVALLDATYLWPMLSAQAEFPRRTADVFTDPLGLLLHALIPLRGKITHGSGKGHELTVFIGPVLAWLLWRYRHTLTATLPRTLQQPLLVVAGVSILLGMGSLQELHMPRWLSPFDWLRPLPGFRSIGVTARYWGFLSLPLSLFGAVALQRWMTDGQARRVGLWLGAALLIQVGVQGEVLYAQWHAGRPYAPIAPERYFQRHRSEQLSYVVAPAGHLQGEFITPTTGVINCYNMDDFLHARVEPGQRTIVAESVLPSAQGQAARPAPATPHPLSAVAAAPAAVATEVEVISWNQLRLHLAADPDPAGTRTVVLNQAWNRHWRAAECSVTRGVHNQLTLSCSNAALARGVTLTFADEASALGTAVTVRAWRSALLLGLLCALILAGHRYGRGLTSALSGHGAH